MEHIVKMHILPVPEGASFFLSTDVEIVCAIIKETHERPDEIVPHRFKKDRKVLRKKFSRQVGVSGKSKAFCYSVTVIVDIGSNAIITAFPTQ